MFRSLLVIGVFLMHCYCTPKYSKFVGEYHFLNNGIPDYSSYDFWAAHPWKHDPSDSVSSPLQTNYHYDSTVDVFFIHPTTFTDRNDDKWNAAIDDAALNAKTDYSTILFQASAFNQARVFAPRYRQANIKAYFTTDSLQAIKAFELAYEDVKAAFQYYLDHFNEGRPIIIASHSQGSTHAIRLMQEYFDGKPLREKLIAAYIIGMNIPLNSFVELKLCHDSTATGCFCGWRTFKRGHEPSILRRFKESYVTNPLTWTTTEAYADYDFNKGGILRNFNKLYPGVADAQIHENILWSNRPKFPGSFLSTMTNYHIGDINLFYMNIRENMQRRIVEYRNAHH